MRRASIAGAVGFGLGSVGAAISTEEVERDRDDTESAIDDTDRSSEHVHHPELVLVFVDDYHAGVTFQPIDRLSQRAVNDVLGRSTGEGSPVVADPTDYNGYVVVRRPDLPGEYTFAFLNRRTLRRDRRYRFTDDAVLFDERVGLVSAAVAIADRADESAAETTTQSDETTPTIDEPTTQEVIVESTETDDE